MTSATENNRRKVVIIGAGPAGLTAAYELSQIGIKCIVLEKDSTVGGISRTVNYRGYRFDIGGHRFFTKVGRVQRMWRDLLGEDLLTRKRLSRIYYNKKFFFYPLRLVNAVNGLGPWNSFLILASYLYANSFPEREEETFEQWVSNRFGRRLYRTFFKTYTEKVWGIPCSEVRAQWAAQRIKGLSLFTAFKNALIPNHNGRKKQKHIVKTLIDEFDYPKLGPGMMWQNVADRVRQAGSQVWLESEVEAILWNGTRVEALEIKRCGNMERVYGTDFISSMPIREAIQKFKPPAPKEALDSAYNLKYRDFLTVALIIDRADVFPDNWIYVHEPSVKMGRIQNFKNWSPFMVPNPMKTCLGLEYYCFEGDSLWSMRDDELIELGTQELEALGLVRREDVEDGCVVRMPKAYPIYDSNYISSLDILSQFIKGLENFQTVGRNGMHKYNNQDHSMLTAMLAVENILGADRDLWNINEEREYHEEITSEAEERFSPGRLAHFTPMQDNASLFSTTERMHDFENR